MAQVYEIKEKSVEQIMAEHGLAGYRKVLHEGGTFVFGGFYNPETKDFTTRCIRDYDYSDCSRDDDDLYYMEIDEEAVRKMKHDQGFILEGDLVVVYKGRNVRIGTIGYIREIKPWKDKYGRTQSYKVTLSGGERTYLHNVRLLEAM